MTKEHKTDESAEFPLTLSISVNGIHMQFRTGKNLFSPQGLDAGTKAMLSSVSFEQGDKVLDLGCGYGIVGIYAAKQIGAASITMVDKDEAAVAASRENARLNGVPDIRIVQSDGFRQLDETAYTLILSNPPYHADFSVPKHFIEKGFNRLALGGKLILVTKRKAWYKNKMAAVFGGVHIDEIDGYYVFTAERRSYSYATKNR